jgi:hypothetical protein
MQYYIEDPNKRYDLEILKQFIYNSKAITVKLIRNGSEITVITQSATEELSNIGPLKLKQYPNV